SFPKRSAALSIFFRPPWRSSLLILLAASKLPPPNALPAAATPKKTTSLATYPLFLSPGIRIAVPLRFPLSRRFQLSPRFSPPLSAVVFYSFFRFLDFKFVFVLLQMLKTAAVNPSLPCGCRPGLNGAVLGPRKVLAAGSEPFHEVHNHIRKPQSGTTASNYPELGILQKQRVVQNRVSPFLGPGFGLPRSSTGSGTGVFHPRVENTEATAPDAAKTNLREFSVHEISHHHHVRQIPDRFLSASVISGKHRRRERVQVAAADQVEGKPSMEESGGEEEEEEDCYYHLPPEIDLLIR
ncbi:hypothetical protein LINPERPRIM_LOCUS16393, partial [Linum perenne]